jgi:hypothetical protein
MSRKWIGAFALAVGSLAAAADPPAVPGPYRAFVVTDARYDKWVPKAADEAKGGGAKADRKARQSTRNRAGMMHDLVTDTGLNPGLAVFARSVPAATDAPVAKLADRLDALVSARQADRLTAFVVFLTLGKEYPEDEGRDAKRAEVEKLADQLADQSATKMQPFRVPFALAAAKSEATDAWGLKDTAEVTVVFFHRMRVIGRWEFTADKPIDDAAVKAITDAVNKELATKP